MERKYDLTHGGILDKLLLVAVPIMLTQLMQMAYNLVDIAYLGRVGADAVAASGTAGFYLWLSNGLLMLGRMGAEIGVAQALGRGERDSAMRYARGAIWIAAITGVSYGALMITGRRLFIGFFGLDDAGVVANAQKYLCITALAMPFTFLTGAINATFTASGNSRLPFKLSGAGLVLNMVLDPLMIFGLHMGVIGAATATALSQMFVCVLATVSLKRSKQRPFESFRVLTLPDREHVGQMIRWALPVSLENMLFTFLSMMTTRLVAYYGAGAMATVNVGSQIESLSWLVGGGFGSAVTAFIGQNYGAGRQDRIDRCVKLSLVVMGVWGSIVTLSLFCFGGTLFGLFLPDEALLPLGIVYLRIMAYSEFFMCEEGVLGGAFRACGQTRQPAFASIVSNIARVILAWALSKTALGVRGIFWGVTLTTIARVVWIALWYYHSRSAFACATEVK